MSECEIFMNFIYGILWTLAGLELNLCCLLKILQHLYYNYYTRITTFEHIGILVSLPNVKIICSVLSASPIAIIHTAVCTQFCK